MERLKSMRLDPFPQLTETIGEHLSKPRLLILTAILTKICLDRVYQYAKIVNPNAELDSDGFETLDILEYHHPKTAADVYDFIAGYGAKGRQAYGSLLFYDCGFLVCRTLPLCVLTYYGFQRAPKWIHPGVWIHLLTTAWDLGENAVLYALMKLYPSRIDFLAWLACGLIQGKWILFWTSIALITASMLFGIYYGFHGLLADSVLFEKDRQERLKARRDIQRIVQRQRAGGSSSAKKNA